MDRWRSGCAGARRQGDGLMAWLMSKSAAYLPKLPLMARQMPKPAGYLLKSRQPAPLTRKLRGYLSRSSVTTYLMNLFSIARLPIQAIVYPVRFKTVAVPAFMNCIYAFSVTSASILHHHLALAAAAVVAAAVAAGQRVAGAVHPALHPFRLTRLQGIPTWRKSCMNNTSWFYRLCAPVRAEDLNFSLT